MEVNRRRDILINQLSDTGFFGSVHDVRVLVTLLETGSELSAEELHCRVGISRSRVYAALNRLERARLTSKSVSSHPRRYYVFDPAVIERFLHRRLKAQVREGRERVSEIVKRVHAICFDGMDKDC